MEFVAVKILLLELALLNALGRVHKELTTEWGRRGLSTHGLVEATLSGFLKSRSMIRHPDEILKWTAE